MRIVKRDEFEELINMTLGAVGTMQTTDKGLAALIIDARAALQSISDAITSDCPNPVCDNPICDGCPCPDADEDEVQ